DPNLLDVTLSSVINGFIVGLFLIGVLVPFHLIMILVQGHSRVQRLCKSQVKPCFRQAHSINIHRLFTRKCYPTDPFIARPTVCNLTNPKASIGCKGKPVVTNWQSLMI